MGFSGGGSSQTKPHTHDSNVVNDGGSLNFDNVTQGSLTAGDITYSDGTHLQRLALGNPADSLVVNGGGTAPEWGASGSGSGAWEFVEEFVLGSKQVYFTCTLASPIALADYNVMCQWWLKNESISSNMEARINGNTVYLNGSTGTSGWTVSGGVQIPANSWSIGHFTYYGNTIDTDFTMGFLECTHGKQSGGEPAGLPYSASFRQSVATTTITEIEFLPTNGDQYAGNIVRVYKQPTS